jgi:DNA repair protein RecO (recombination protein O)
MPEFRTRAIVLRTFDHGESDRLVHLYTEALGRVSALAKGARRSRRRFPGTLEIFTILDARIVEPPRASLLRLEGARLERPFEGLVNDLGRYAVACQLVEVLDRLTGEHESNPELFQFAVGVLDVLAAEVPDRLLALLVLTKTLAHLGYRPQLLHCGVCGSVIGAHLGYRPQLLHCGVCGSVIGPSGGQVGFAPRHGGAVCRVCCGAEEARVPAGLLRAVEEGIRTPLRERGRLALSAPAVRHAELLLERFFRFHVEVELKSAAFLRNTLSFEPVDADPTREDAVPPPTGGVGREPQTDRRV